MVSWPHTSRDAAWLFNGHSCVLALWDPSLRMVTKAKQEAAAHRLDRLPVSALALLLARQPESLVVMPAKAPGAHSPRRPISLEGPLTSLTLSHTLLQLGLPSPKAPAWPFSNALLC